VDEGLVQVRFVDQPPMIELVRGDGVPEDFWHGLPLYLEPSSHQRNGQGRMRVAIERFLANRRRLSDECESHTVGLEFDAQVLALLERALEERRAVDERLDADDGSVPAAQPIRETLSDGRYVRDLRSFQVRDLAKLIDLQHGANFSVPGAGKTAVAYALYEVERLRDRVSRLLVVAPLSAFEAWETEAIKCFSEPPVVRRFDGRIPHDAEVLLVNYQKLKGYYDQLSTWLYQASSHLILDEAHRMKRGRFGQWGSACLDLSHLAIRRDILTGTPAPQGPGDFIALVDFVWPSQARRILPAAALQNDPPDNAMARVSDALEPLFSRTTKSELGLDPPNLQVEPVQMKPLQYEIYEALRSRYSGMFDLSRRDQAMLAQMGEVMMYLLEAATNPRLLVRHSSDQSAAAYRYPALSVATGSPLGQLIMRYPDHELPPKFEKVAVLVERNASRGRKTLVWSNFIGNLLDLEHLLALYDPALIYGAIPSDDGSYPEGVRTRERELARFRSSPDCKVLLANPAAMAEGVSLHDACHDAVYVERTFNAGQYLQSLDRIHRLGLAPGTDTNITFLLTEGTIDEAVDARVNLKAERLGSMLNDPDLVTMALPDDEDYGETIEDVADLTALFEHLGDSD
jgi:SNF2 family DNA or RNA helicase